MLIQVKARRCFGDIPRPISCVQAALHGAHQVPSCQMQVHLLNSEQHRCRLRSGVVECSLCSADAALYIIPTSVVSHVHVCVSFHASLIGGSLFLQEPKWSRQKINIVHAACETCKTSSFGHVQRMRCVELVFRYGSNPTTVYLRVAVLARQPGKLNSITMCMLHKRAPVWSQSHDTCRQGRHHTPQVKVHKAQHTSSTSTCKSVNKHQLQLVHRTSC